MSNPALKEWPLWEVFVRSKQGLQMARDVYTRRQEGVSIWVVPSASISASEPNDKSEFFDPASDKVYRHPTFYDIPEEVGHM
jgi:ring-1,2-phenylacetyl-CoA epoxidase subunit PaaB